VKTLITGTSGFLGGILKDAFTGQEVLGLARSGADIPCDLAAAVPQLPADIEYVIHAAGKAHTVPKSQEEIDAFFKVNLTGTVNLTKGLNLQTLKGFMFISTVAVYGEDVPLQTDESAPLLGESPYALSKIQAEAYLQEWAKTNAVPLLIVRLPLISGANPPGNLKKMIDGLRTGKYLSIDNGRAKRSIVSAYDVAEFLKSSLGKEGIFNLTDQRDPSFKEIEDHICQLIKSKPPKNISFKIAKVLGSLGDILKFVPVNSSTIKKMSSDLTFSSEKATKKLNWEPSNAVKAIHIS